MPDLYRDVVLDIRMGAKCPYVFGYTEKWTDGLRGLALNTHNQCQYVRSFTIMNSHPGRWFPRLPLDPSDYSDSIFDNGEYLSCSEKYPSLAFVSTLLEIALQNMLMLKEFTYDHFPLFCCCWKFSPTSSDGPLASAPPILFLMRYPKRA